jgi:anthranilate synthase/aminodeoxychorismate synthase-like glutamine amidotransferase
VDNYDSFAFNLVQALGVLGADVVVRRNDAVTAQEALALAPGAIVLSPGPKTPDEAGVSVPLVLAAAERRVPLLGVCLGHQAIGRALGGRIVRADRLLHGKTSRVRHDASALFAGVPQDFEAMRYHSLVVAEPLPEGLVRTAWSADAGELMAFRHAFLPLFGVQFHPESYRTGAGPTILGNFLGLSKGPPR